LHALDQALFPSNRTLQAKANQTPKPTLNREWARAVAVLAAALDARYLNGRMSQAGLKTDLRAIVGEQGMLEGAAVRERAGTLWHGRIDAELLVRPRTTEQVSAVLKLCHARGQPVVTHGGLTGLVNGADAEARDIILSLNR
jgi:hypothetical protein